MTRPRRLQGQRPAGKRAADKPTPGWKARNPFAWFVNPRPPSVPSTMDLRLDEYYAGACVIGVLASQGDEPNPDWLCGYSWKLADKMVAEAKRRRRRKT